MLFADLAIAQTYERFGAAVAPDPPCAKVAPFGDSR